MNWLLKKLRPPVSDFRTVGSALLKKLKPPTESFKIVGSTFLQKLKPPVEDYRTVRRAGSSLLDKLRTSPAPYVRKGLGVIPKVGEVYGKVATGFVFGDVKEKGIAGIPEHLWEVEKHIGKIPFKFGMSALLASTKPGKVEKKPWKLPVLGEVSTYQKDAQDIFSKVIDGKLPLAYGMLPILETVWDASIASSLFRQGAKSVIKKIKVPEKTHIGAWEFLGKKPTIGATRKEVAKLQKTFHPDKPFGSVKKSAAINDAYSILKKQGIPKVKPFQAGIKRGLEMFEKPVSELMRTPSGRAYAGLRGLLPQRAGYMPTQPYQPRRPAFGLSIKETGEKPISKISKELEPLAKEARKYKSAEEFVKAKQKDIVYHGSNIEDIKDFKFMPAEREMGMGFKKKVEPNAIFFTKDKKIAKMFAENRAEYFETGKPTIYERFLETKKTADFTNIDNTDKILKKAGLEPKEIWGLYDDSPNTIRYLLEDKEMVKEDLFVLMDKKEYVDKLKALGYDSAKVMEKGGTSIAVFSPSQIKTKSQLTDIYNKAKPSLPKITKADPLTTEARKYKSAEEFVKTKPKVYHGGNIDSIDDIKWDDSYLGTMRTQSIRGQAGDPIRAFGVNFADIKDIAKDFSQTGRVLEVIFTPKKIKKYKTDNELLNKLLDLSYKKRGQDINWLDAKKIRNIDKKNEFMIDNNFDEYLVKEMKDDLLEKGYDAIQFRNTLDGGITIIPLKKSAIKTKSQLTDIYTQATKEVKPISKISTAPKELELVKEARKYKSAEEFVRNFEKIGERNAAKIERGLFVKPDDYVLVYHGTPSLENLSKIEKTGFKLGMPKSFQGKENAIYVNLDKNVGTYAQGGGIIKARVKSKYLISDPERAGQFYVQNPNYVEVLEKGIYEGTHLYPTFKPATQLKQFYTQAVKEVKPVIEKAVKPKLLTTPDIAGKGFVMKGLSKRYGLLPATRMKRELETARRMRIEKKVTDPLLKRIDKTNTRKEQIRIVRDYFGLTDAEIKSISRKDVGLMSDFEFKNFIDDVRIRADKLGKKRQAMNELLQQIKDKEIDVENMRKAMKLPTMKNMAITDIQKLDEALKPFQKGDEFLSVRKLEVVDRTELKGIKTWREARERLAKKLNVPVEELQNIKVSEFDRFRYDTALAEKNPFYKMMVEESAGKMLVSEAEYLKLEKDVFALAKKLKPKGITGRIIPQQKNIRAFMEAKPEDRAKIILTETEQKLVKLMTKEFEDVRSYLIQMEAMKMGKENYFTHIRRGILEAVREDGMIKAVKEVFTQYKLEEQAFDILDTQTGEILAMDKFFRFAMHRTGEIKPTENTVKAFLTYMKTFKKKQALDEVVPLIDIYAHSLTPKGLTKKGLLLHGNLQRFVKEWLNTKKGRHITLMAKQNGKIDGALRSIKMFTSLRDLGINIPVSVASQIGEQVTTYQLLGKWKFGLGKVRQNTKQGKAIIEKYRNLIGKNPWRELVEPSKEAGDRLMEGIFILFRDASTRANKTFLLGSLSKQELKSGIITPERLSALRTELGRYRVVEGMKSVMGATPEGKTQTQYKTWAIPPATSNIKNIGILIKKLAGQSKGSNEWKKSILETYRLIEVIGFSFIIREFVKERDDNSFAGQIINKMYRELNTLIQSIRPDMFLATNRTISFLTELGENLTSILLWEKYKTKEGLKGVEGLKKQLTPVVVRQITKATEEPKTEYDKAVSEDKGKDKEAREKIKPIYDEIQRLKNEGKKDEAKKIGDKLSDEEYEIYKKIMSSEKTKETKRMKEELYPKFLKIQELKETDYDEGLRIINSLSEEEYRIYELLKAQLD